MKSKFFYHALSLNPKFYYFYLLFPGELNRFDLGNYLESAVPISKLQLVDHGFKEKTQSALEVDLTSLYLLYDAVTLFLIAKHKSTGKLSRKGIKPTIVRFRRKLPLEVSFSKSNFTKLPDRKNVVDVEIVLRGSLYKANTLSLLTGTEALVLPLADVRALDLSFYSEKTTPLFAFSDNSRVPVSVTVSSDRREYRVLYPKVNLSFAPDENSLSLVAKTDLDPVQMAVLNITYDPSTSVSQEPLNLRFLFADPLTFSELSSFTLPVALDGSFDSLSALVLYQVIGNVRDLVQIVPVTSDERAITFTWEPHFFRSTSGQLVVEALDRMNDVLVTTVHNFTYTSSLNLVVDTEKLFFDSRVDELSVNYSLQGTSQAQFVRVDFVRKDGTFLSADEQYSLPSGEVTFSKSELLDFSSVRFVVEGDVDLTVTLPVQIAPYIVSLAPRDSNILFVSLPSSWSVRLAGDISSDLQIVWGYEVSGQVIPLSDAVGLDATIVLPSATRDAKQLVVTLLLSGDVVHEYSSPITVFDTFADIPVEIQGPSLVSVRADVTYTIKTTASFQIFYAVSSLPFTELVAERFNSVSVHGLVPFSPLVFRLHDLGITNLYVYLFYQGQYSLLASKRLFVVDEIPSYRLDCAPTVLPDEDFVVNFIVEKGVQPSRLSWTFATLDGPVTLDGDYFESSASLRFPSNLMDKRVDLRVEAFDAEDVPLGVALGAVDVGRLAAVLSATGFPQHLSVEEPVSFSVSCSQELVHGSINAHIYSSDGEGEWEHGPIIGSVPYIPVVPGDKKLVICAKLASGEPISSSFAFTVAPLPSLSLDLVISGKPYASRSGEIYLSVSEIPEDLSRVEWWIAEGGSPVSKVGEGVELRYNSFVSDVSSLSFVALGFDAADHEEVRSNLFVVHLFDSPPSIVSVRQKFTEEKVLFAKLIFVLYGIVQANQATQTDLDEIQSLLTRIDSLEKSVASSFSSLLDTVVFERLYDFDVHSLFGEGFESFMNPLSSALESQDYSLALRYARSIAIQIKDRTTLFSRREEILDRCELQLTNPPDATTLSSLPSISLDETS